MANIASQYQDPETGKRLPRGGGKLNRTETVTVRLDPKLNYLCDLSARAQRRTKSSFIEWAIETALKSVAIPGTGNWDNPDKSIDDLASQLWDVDEVDRLIALAQHAPILMDHEEQLLWKSIRSNGWLWRGRYIGADNDGAETWTWDATDFSMLLMERLRKHFDGIKAYIRGESNATGCPEWLRTKPIKPFDSDLDDDVPF
jgi:hypothetical protein